MPNVYDNVLILKGDWTGYIGRVIEIDEGHEIPLAVQVYGKDVPYQFLTPDEVEKV